MKIFTFIIAMLLSTMASAAPAALNITWPIKYQTIFNANGDLRVKFDINATTLHKLPARLQLYINNQLVSDIRYGQASSFEVKGLQAGHYMVIVAATGHDGKMLTISDPVDFTFKRKGFEIAR